MIGLEEKAGERGKRERYIHDVQSWSLLMLKTVKDLPDTAEKITLLRQLDKVKDATKILLEELPAYAGALAVLSLKATNLKSGKLMGNGYSKEEIIALVRSEILKQMLAKEPGQFIHLKEFLDVTNKKRASDTLTRLSKSGH